MKLVLITGSNSGFGLITAITLAKKGYKILATMRDINKGEQLLSKAHEENVKEYIETYQMDITNQYEIENTFDTIHSKYGKLDILINNAGFAQGGFFEELTMDDYRRQFETNFFGHIQVTKQFLPLLKNNGSGKIINISSISGYFGFPGLSPYTSSKHALEGWSESLRLELATENIWVSLVEPASYKTNIWKKSLDMFELSERRPHEQKLINQAKQSSESAEDPQKVGKLIAEICHAKRPKLRYPIGKGTTALYLGKSLLPWRLIEFIVQQKLK